MLRPLLLISAASLMMLAAYSYRPELFSGRFQASREQGVPVQARPAAQAGPPRSTTPRASRTRRSVPAQDLTSTQDSAPRIEGACASGDTQASTVVVREPDTPVYIYPRVLPVPLKSFPVGAVLSVSERSSEWLTVAWQDSQWGRRTGYVHCSNVLPKQQAQGAPQGRPEPYATAAQAVPAPTGPPVSESAQQSTRQPETTKSGMSRKKKIVIAAAITGAVIGAAIIAKKLASDGEDDKKKRRGGGGGAGGDFSAPVSVQRELLLFGGPNHKVFLGCLTCSEFDASSVFNRFGQHGSSFGTESILNSFSDYGSRFSNYSACNPFASDPPIIVDRQGQAYGRLTLNRTAYQINEPQTIAWLRGVCQS